LQANASVPDFTITIADPAQTPYVGSLSSANYAYIESPTLAYRYFDLSSTKIERVRSWLNNTLNTHTHPQVYNNPVKDELNLSFVQKESGDL